MIKSDANVSVTVSESPCLCGSMQHRIRASQTEQTRFIFQIHELSLSKKNARSEDCDQPIASFLQDRSHA